MSGGIGVGCVALALFFVVPGFETPDEVFGAFVPTAVAMLALGVTVLALAPLRWGDSLDRTPTMIARLLLAVALLGTGLTVAAILRGQWPYVLGALLPAAAIVAVLRSARGFARLRSSASGLAPESR